MKINRKELLIILSACRPGLAKREIIEEAIRFIFTGDAVATYNDQICIVYPYKTDFRCSVNGEEFYKILDGIKEDEVEILVEENQTLVNSRKTKAGLSIVIGETERVDTLIDNIREATKVRGFWKKLPKDFIEGVFLCMFSASKDMTTGVRCCIAVKENKMYSTDSVRVSRYIMDGEIMDELLIPARDAVELVKYPVKKYGISESWIHFITDEGVMFNCRMMIGDYPYTIDRFFRAPENEFVVPEELQEVMKNIAIMASGDVDIAKMVEVTIKNDKMICKSEKERGWITKEVAIEGYKGEIMFYINPIFFAQILTKVTSLFLIQGEEFPDKAVFTRESFQHVMALPA